MMVLQRNHPFHMVLEKSKPVFFDFQQNPSTPQPPLTIGKNQNVQIVLPECQLAHHYF